MRQWIGPVLLLVAFVALRVFLPNSTLLTLAGIGAALFWVLLLSSNRRSRRWDEVSDHRRDSPRSSR